MTTPAAAARFARTYIGDLAAEHAIVIPIDARNRPYPPIVVGQGSLSSAQVPPAAVVQAMLLANAAGGIIAHNHPSGVGVPSPEDRVFTAHIAKALRAVGLQLLDSLVVTETGHHSMQEHGTLPTE